MRFALHLLVVIALALPFEVNHWLQADQIETDATVLASLIVETNRTRVPPFVWLDLQYVVEGRDYRSGIVMLQPADGRFNWTADERAAAEHFVASHRAGDTIRIWVPRRLPGDGATLATDGYRPASRQRGPAYLACLGLLALYLVAVGVRQITRARPAIK